MQKGTQLCAFFAVSWQRRGKLVFFDKETEERKRKFYGKTQNMG